MTRIKYVCPLCNLEQETTTFRYKRKKTPFCKNCVTVGTQKGIRKPEFSRENSSRWKGGEYISSDGYKMVKAENEYHPSGRQKYKKEHIVIYEQFLGRELQTGKRGNGEQLHHIDGVKLNNCLDNLVYCKGISEHRLLHCQLEEIAFELVRLGLIKFDKITYEYFIDKDFSFNESTFNS